MSPDKGAFSTKKGLSILAKIESSFRRKKVSSMKKSTVIVRSKSHSQDAYVSFDVFLVLLKLGRCYAVLAAPQENSLHPSLRNDNNNNRLPRKLSRRIRKEKLFWDSPLQSRYGRDNCLQVKRRPLKRRLFSS